MTQPRRIVLGAAALALALSVAAPADAQAPPPPRVAILVSGPLPAYQRPVATFRDTLAQAIPGVTFEVHDVGSDRAAAEAMVDGLVDRDVALVFATGARAAYVAATAQAEIPVVFASVLDWQSYRRALGRPHVAGVALETPPDAQLAHMKLLVPGLRRVVVVTPSAGHEPAALADLRQAARVLGVDIVVVPVAAVEDELARRASRGAIDTAVYPLADPAVYTPEHFLALQAACRRHRLPLIAFSRQFVEAGAVLSVDVNYDDLGSQAALLAVEILADKARPEALGVAAPVGTSLAVNEAAAGAIGLELPPSLVRLAGVAYDSIAEIPEDELRDRAASSAAAAVPAARGDRDPWAEPLSELSFFQVEAQIVSVASRWAQESSQAPSIVSVLTNEELRALGVRNLAEALELLPGFTYRYNHIGQYDLLFRGQKAPADLLVLLDGERLNSLYDGSVDYEVPIDNIRRIEVIRGPGSALYGSNAFAGVISVLTYEPGADRAVAVDGTWFPSSSAPHDGNTFAGRAWARQTERLGRALIGVSAVAGASQGARMRMPYDVTGVFPAGQRRLLDDRDRTFEATLSLRVGDLVARGDRLRVLPKFLVHQEGPNFGPAETLATDSRLRRTTWQLPVEYTVPFGRRLELTTRLAYATMEIDQDLQIRPDGFTNRANPIPAPDGLRQRRSYSVFGFRVEPQLRWRLPPVRALWSKAVLTAGALGEYAALGGFRYDQNYLEYAGTVIYYENFSAALRQQLEDAGIPTTGFQNYNALVLAQRKANRYLASAYAEGQLEIPRNRAVDAWLTAGVRTDVFSDYRAPAADGTRTPRKRFVTTNPRGAIVVSPSFGGWLTGVTLKAIHGWAFRAPTFAELYDSTTKVTESSFRIPNEKLEPQTTRVSELGLELRPIRMIDRWRCGPGGRDPAGDALALRVNAFDMRTDDVLLPDPLFNPAGYQITNLVGEHVTGVEAEVELRVTPRDFAFANLSIADPQQIGDCIRREADGSCPSDRRVQSHDIREFPERRINVGVAFRPVGLALELLDRRDSAAHRWLEPLQLSVKVHTVSESANNQRVDFEQLRFAFRHPGYAFGDVGLSYQWPLAGNLLRVRAFVHNITDADVAEPLILELEPRPTYGYFLPRPGRTLTLSAEWEY